MLYLGIVFRGSTIVFRGSTVLYLGIVFRGSIVLHQGVRSTIIATRGVHSIVYCVCTIIIVHWGVPNKGHSLTYTFRVSTHSTTCPHT